jgi:hypothetical protein
MLNKKVTTQNQNSYGRNSMQVKKNVFLQSLILSFAFALLSFNTTKAAEQYTSAYGPQATMSPASTSSINYGNASSQQAALPQNNYAPGNSVYLSGQQPFAQPQSMMQQNPYYAPQASMQQQTMPQTSPYGSQYPSMGSYQQQPYPAVDPSAYNAQNSYMTTKPSYGQPAYMVQRNSASYATDNNFPYRNNPSVVLNPNSMTGSQQNQKVNPAVMNILGNNSQANNPTQSANSNTQGNWFKKVFHVTPASNRKVSRW